VSSSYSTGTVAGTFDGGGLVGWNRGTVSNSYSTCDVTGGNYAGGLVGWNYDDGTVSNSYSTATVTCGWGVGGLLGSVSAVSISNSFWDTETSGQATSGGGTGKSTAQMKSISTFAPAWNIITVANPSTRNLSYIWNIVDGQTYPFLSWQSMS
jgi:hypothetical protein